MTEHPQAGAEVDREPVAYHTFLEGLDGDDSLDDLVCVLDMYLVLTILDPGDGLEVDDTGHDFDRVRANIEKVVRWHEPTWIIGDLPSIALLDIEHLSLFVPKDEAAGLRQTDPLCVLPHPVVLSRPGVETLLQPPTVFVGKPERRHVEVEPNQRFHDLLLSCGEFLP